MEIEFEKAYKVNDLFTNSIWNSILDKVDSDIRYDIEQKVWSDHQNIEDEIIFDLKDIYD